MAEGIETGTEKYFDERPQEPMKKPWETGMRFGIIGGLISVSVALLANLLGLVQYELNADGSQPSNTLQTFLSVAIFVAVLFLAVREHRDKVLGGFISFGKAFGVTAMATVMMSFISGIYTYIFFAFIEPDVIDAIFSQAMEQMEDQGQDVEGMEGMMRAFMSPLFFAASGFLSGTIMGMLVGLVVSAVTKKEA